MNEYPLPSREELYKLRPYRVNKQIKDKINYLFSHPKLPSKHRKLFIDVSTSGTRTLLNDMGRVAISLTRYYLEHPQQYGGAFDNIRGWILYLMWKQTFKHCKLQEYKLDKYYSTKMKLLGIDNGFWDELLKVTIEEDYILTNDDMVKKRTNIGIRDRVSFGTHEGGTNFEYICRLAENEVSSLISDNTSLD